MEIQSQPAMLGLIYVITTVRVMTIYYLKPRFSMQNPHIERRKKKILQLELKMTPWYLLLKSWIAIQCLIKSWGHK
jgi:hypothetical protein